MNDKDYIKEKFHKQYHYNAQLPIMLHELELTKKNHNEDFVTFLTKWKKNVMHMTNRSSEEDQVRLVILNLQSEHGEHSILAYRVFHEALQGWSTAAEKGSSL